MRSWLALKLSAALLLSSAIVFAAFGYWNLRLQRRDMEELVLLSADRISDLILRATRYQMMRNDREALYEAIRNIGSQRGIRRVRIYNKLGAIQFSTDPAEWAGRWINKRRLATAVIRERSR